MVVNKWTHEPIKATRLARLVSAQNGDDAGENEYQSVLHHLVASGSSRRKRVASSVSLFIWRRSTNACAVYNHVLAGVSRVFAAVFAQNPIQTMTERSGLGRGVEPEPERVCSGRSSPTKRHSRGRGVTEPFASRHWQQQP